MNFHHRVAESRRATPRKNKNLSETQRLLRDSAVKFFLF
jgi:hypothetical protein